MTTAVTDPTMDLIERDIETRDPDAREQLVTNYLPLVRSIARRFRNSREPMEDLVQMGTIGLLSAIEKFDMSHGVRFASLAIPEVYGAILNHLRDHGGLFKVPRALRHNRISLDRCTERLISHFGRWPTTAEMATESGLTEDAVNEALEFARTGDPRSLDASFNGDFGEEGSALVEILGSEEPAFGASLDRMVLQSAMDKLPLRERTIISLKFYRGLSQRQIASRINISQMHVSRLERRALAKMKDIVAGHEVDSIGMDREPATLQAAS